MFKFSLRITGISGTRSLTPFSALIQPLQLKIMVEMLVFKTVYYETLQKNYSILIYPFLPGNNYSFGWFLFLYIILSLEIRYIKVEMQDIFKKRTRKLPFKNTACLLKKKINILSKNSNKTHLKDANIQTSKPVQFLVMAKTIQKKTTCKKAKGLSENTLQIAGERREAKGKGERERQTQLKADVQGIARKDQKAFLKRTMQRNRGTQLNGKD